MARDRRFEPAGLVAGLVFLGVALAFGGDAAGIWHPKPVVVIFYEVCGLVVVGFARLVTNAVRGRGERRTGVPRDAAQVRDDVAA